MDIDLKQLRELLRAFKQFDLSELVIENGDERIKLRRGAGGGVAPVMGAPTSAPTPSMFPANAPSGASETIGSASAPVAVAPEDPNVVYVTSPFVGTFYRSPSPDSGAFVEVGAVIKPGQVLCIVEAMKLMNEIEAEIGGTILEALVDNGKPVEYGDRLFKVRKA